MLNLRKWLVVLIEEGIGVIWNMVPIDTSSTESRVAKCGETRKHGCRDCGVADEL